MYFRKHKDSLRPAFKAYETLQAAFNDDNHFLDPEIFEAEMLCRARITTCLVPTKNLSTAKVSFDDSCKNGEEEE